MPKNVDENQKIPAKNQLWRLILPIFIIFCILTSSHKSYSQSLGGVATLLSVSSIMFGLINENTRQQAASEIQSEFINLQYNQHYIETRFRSILNNLPNEINRNFMHQDFEELQAILSEFSVNHHQFTRDSVYASSLMSRVDRLVFKLGLYENALVAPLFANAAMLQYSIKYSRGIEETPLRFLLDQHRETISQWLDMSNPSSIPRQMQNAIPIVTRNRHLYTSVNYEFPLLEHVTTTRHQDHRTADIRTLTAIYHGINLDGYADVSLADNILHLDSRQDEISGRYRSRRNNRSFIYYLGDERGLRTECVVRYGRDSEYRDMSALEAEEAAQEMVDCIGQWYQVGIDEVEEIRPSLADLSSMRTLLQSMLDFNDMALANINSDSVGGDLQ